MLSKLVLATLAALAAAGPMEKRQTSSGGVSNVLKDIHLACSDIGTLQHAIDSPGCDSCAYGGDELVAILQDNQAVLYDIGNGTEAVKASKTFGKSDSNELASAVQSSLVPTVTALLNDVKAHHPAFKSQGFEAVVSSILVVQKSSAVAFADAFKTKVSGPATTVPAAVSSSIVSYFNEAISVYKN